MQGIEKFKTTPGLERPEVKVETESGKPRTEILLPETLKFKRNHFDIAEFDPYWELREIRKFVRGLPPEVQSSQRRTLIRDFKAKLGTMRENNAQMAIGVEKMLREDPDISIKELVRKLRELVTKNSMNLGPELEDGIAKFVRIRDGIKSVIDHHKALSAEDKTRKEWQAELFKDLFGRYPIGHIEIEVVFGGLYFRIFDIEDYVLAYVGSEEQSISTQNRNARMSGGAKLNRKFPILPQLSDRVILENASILGQSSSGTRTHEEEHSIHSNLYPKELFDYSGRMRIFESTNRVLNYDVFQKRIGKYAHLLTRGVKDDAKTEVLAYLKTGDWRGSIATIRFALMDDNGLYNYFKDSNTEDFFRNTVLERVRAQNLRIRKDGLELGEAELKKACSDVITNAWNKDYKKTLELALDSVQALLEKYGDDPENRLKVIRLLAQEPLDKWPRLVKILS